MSAGGKRAGWVVALPLLSVAFLAGGRAPLPGGLFAGANARGGAVGWRRSMDDIACCPSEAEDEEDAEGEDE
jgi:hypothetical protein